MTRTSLKLSTTNAPAVSSSSPPPPPPSPPPPCATTSLGYARSAVLSSRVTLHWTTHDDTINPCAETTSSSATDAHAHDAHDHSHHHRRRRSILMTDATKPTVKAPAAGDVAFAVEATGGAGTVAVSFQTTAAMVPAKAVMGWMSSDNGRTTGRVGSYRLTGKTLDGVRPDDAEFPLRETSVETTGGGVTVMRFAARMSDVGSSRFTSSGAAGNYIGWSLASGAGKLYHDVGHGVSVVDFATGAARDAHGHGVDWRAHGWLMTAGFGCMTVGATVARLKTHAAASGWFLAHRALQVTGAALAVAGVAVALDRESIDGRAFDWSKATADEALKAHGAAGVVVAAAPLLQALLGWRREPKGAPGRSPIRRAHVCLGWCVVAIGAGNCLLGAYLYERKTGGDGLEVDFAVAATAMLVLIVSSLAHKALAPTARAEAPRQEDAPTAKVEMSPRGKT